MITDPEEYWAKVRPWLRVVGQHKGILKASDEDVEFLAQVDSPGGDPVDVLADWVSQYGIGLGVVTLGPGGAVAVDPEGTRTAVQGFPTTVVDTVGAGDTFMAGFLDGYVGTRRSDWRPRSLVAQPPRRSCAPAGARSRRRRPRSMP